MARLEAGTLGTMLRCSTDTLYERDVSTARRRQKSPWSLSLISTHPTMFTQRSR